MVYYKFIAAGEAAEQLSQRMLMQVFRGYLAVSRPFFRLRPFLADGIILVASPMSDSHPVHAS
jgi:hypothetical protein